MKYEPTRRLNSNSSDIEWLMMPFAEEPDTDNGELSDIIQEILMGLPEEMQTLLHGLFYERKPYQEIAEDMGWKAKSHAWRRTAAAIQELKERLIADDRFKSILAERYGIHDLG